MSGGDLVERYERRSLWIRRLRGSLPAVVTTVVLLVLGSDVLLGIFEELSDPSGGPGPAQPPGGDSVSYLNWLPIVQLVGGVLAGIAVLVWMSWHRRSPRLDLRIADQAWAAVVAERRSGGTNQ